MPDSGRLAHLPYLLALERERDWHRAAAAGGVSAGELMDIVRAAEHWHGQPLVAPGVAFEGFTPQGERILALARELQAGLDALEQCFIGSRSRSMARLQSGADVTGTT